MCAIVETLCKHVDAVKVYYSNWTEQLSRSGLSLTSAVVTFNDTALSIGAVTVTVSDVTPDGETISAGKAFQFQLSSGTSLGIHGVDAEAKTPHLGEIKVTFSDGTIDARQMKLVVYGT